MIRSDIQKIAKIYFTWVTYLEKCSEAILHQSSNSILVSIPVKD